VIFTDSEHVLLSYMKPEKLSEKLREDDHEEERITVEQ
jgi:regulator of extracellular matrix RemA (YlzA/DUF370 family)